MRTEGDDSGKSGNIMLLHEIDGTRTSKTNISFDGYKNHRNADHMSSRRSTSKGRLFCGRLQSPQMKPKKNLSNTGLFGVDSSKEKKGKMSWFKRKFMSRSAYNNKK